MIFSSTTKEHKLECGPPNYKWRLVSTQYIRGEKYYCTTDFGFKDPTKDTLWETIEEHEAVFKKRQDLGEKLL